MKKITFISIILFACFLSNILLAQVNYQVEVPSTKGSVLQTVKLEDRNNYARLTTPPNLGSIGQHGEPVLPVKHVKILIPPNADANKITCKVSGKQVISLSHKIEPGQHPIPTSLNYKKKEFVPPNPEIYNSRQPYPGIKAEIISQGSLK